MTISILDTLHKEQKEFIFQLWNREYPARLAFPSITDLDIYLNGLVNPVHYVAENGDNTLIAWAPVFERGGEKWFAMILDSDSQRQGLGTTLLKTITEKETELNGWAIDHNNDLKQNGKTYLSPLNFYIKNNFAILNHIRLETNTLSAVKIRWSSNQKD